MLVVLIQWWDAKRSAAAVPVLFQSSLAISFLLLDFLKRVVDNRIHHWQSTMHNSRFIYIHSCLFTCLFTYWLTYLLGAFQTNPNVKSSVLYKPTLQKTLDQFTSFVCKKLLTYILEHTFKNTSCLVEFNHAKKSWRQKLGWAVHV